MPQNPVKYFTLVFYLQLISTRENKREREIARAPIAHPSTDESHPSTSEIVAPQHRLDHHHPRLIHPKPISFSTQSSSMPPFSPSFSTANLSLFPLTAGFDKFFFFFVGFCFFCVYILRNNII